MTTPPDDPSGGFAFAPPPFQPAQALVTLKRALRELKLVERGRGFELGGRPVVELAADDEAIDVRLARRPSVTPEWDGSRLRSAADQRRWLDEVRRRLARWQRED